MDLLGTSFVPALAERRTCLRKLRHDNFLTALHHARRIDDNSISVYSCEFCGGSHVGHHAPAPVAKLKRNHDRLERAKQALRTNNGTMKPAKRQAYEDRIRDLTRRQSQLEAKARRSRSHSLAFPPEVDWWGLVSLLLINTGVWLQHPGVPLCNQKQSAME